MAGVVACFYLFVENEVEVVPLILGTPDSTERGARPEILLDTFLGKSG